MYIANWSTLIAFGKAHLDQILLLGYDPFSFVRMFIVEIFVTALVAGLLTTADSHFYFPLNSIKPCIAAAVPVSWKPSNVPGTAVPRRFRRHPMSASDAELTIPFNCGTLAQVPCSGQS